MTISRAKIHTDQVDAWEKSHTGIISVDELPSLFAKAIQAIERRSLQTLSDVTVKVVLARVLHLGQEKFPILSLVRIEAEGISFKNLLVKNGVAPSELKDGLREFLTDLLSILGNITADIMTPFLHKELWKVNNDTLLVEPETQALHVVEMAKKNRNQK